ncbi:amidohydrolase family protein [Nocardioides sp.]|uniref:amidohydrolase family protein n=1 Tax=Nocardioides sp. TaxID=35761 RepID=UPI002632B154|nr:amidohydrolase family protein [Nocardioides sp.]MCW2736348.1 amidohydrolase [Nocardioides sp.]
MSTSRWSSEVETTRAFADALGLPGLSDLHTHFLPPRVMAKVRAQFDAAGPLIGRPWPLHYRDEDDALVETLRSFGVRRFTALPYAHKPDMAEFLNDWAAGFAERVPEAAVCGTFFPEPGVAAYVASRAETVAVWKVHVQVGAFTVTDPLLDETWGLVAETGTPVVLHAGSGPVATEHTGPGPLAALLARHPRLRLVIAHAGAPEYAEFLALAETYDRVALDTTMAFTPFFEEMGGAYPPGLLPRLRDLGLAGRVHLGSDFPNIPYPYAVQLEALERLDLGEGWLRAVCWANTEALLG